MQPPQLSLFSRSFVSPFMADSIWLCFFAFKVTKCIEEYENDKIEYKERQGWPACAWAWVSPPPGRRARARWGSGSSTSYLETQNKRVIYCTEHRAHSVVQQQSGLHCNENPCYVLFLFWKLRGHSPNFHIMCLRAIYIFPGSVHIFPCSRKGNNETSRRYNPFFNNPSNQMMS
jgi:hypothetical protein